VLKGLIKVITGDNTDRDMKRLEVVARQIIEELGSQYEALSDEALRAKTLEFREQLDPDDNEGHDLEAILPQAFAAVRESAWRTQRKRHYKVQLIGGMVLHQGKISEMRTGEGKTLVATSAVYLNALKGKGAHVVTVNDYLARRDAQWMGPIYHFLGLSVAVIQSNGGDPNRASAFLLEPGFVNEKDPAFNNLRPIPRREAYEADVTYGTNNEFGFDYLRDNMAVQYDALVQRPLYYAVVDEVDNILIDEARTPLIISGPAGKSDDDYYRFAELVRKLRKGKADEDEYGEKRETGDYVVDEKKRIVSLTEAGILKAEKLLEIPMTESIYDDKWSRYTHFLDNALKALALYHRDQEYIVRDGKEVVIVDEFTGRMMEGRRWENGLHQAVEAKEGVLIQHETLTYATITLQNYFRMYKKLAGMTGTAMTEADEFRKIYGLDVVTVPTNRDMIRADHNDLIYPTEQGKYNAVLDEIVEMHAAGRPVLVGTTSVEKSEFLSEKLKSEGIPHNVLNAKLHEREAIIVEQAGRPGAVTIATNMAGRGTDIILGGSPESYIATELKERGLTEADRGSEAYQEAEEAAQRSWQEAHDKVIEAGGLHIIGTERHESRRIDNQLRGRAGRQGDPGSSRFYVSLEDELMRRFGNLERMSGMLGKLGFDDQTPIEHGLISKSIEQAQTKVEGQNFDFRKHLVEYDDVMNKQRETIYRDRQRVLKGEDLRSQILELTQQRLDELVDEYTTGEPDTWDLGKLFRNAGQLLQTGPIRLKVQATSEEHLDELVLQWFEEMFGIHLDVLGGKNPDELKTLFHELAEEMYTKKEEALGVEDTRLIERLAMLKVYDKNWVDYLTPMEDLRKGIGLQSFGQKDPLVAYKTAAFKAWSDLQQDIRREIVQTFWSAQIQRAVQAEAPKQVQESGPSQPETKVKAKPQPAKNAKLGPNEPCFCGSGLKYKKCHGRV
jgi:preprotein translocase subunit SecA